jgi:hypothetical protein
MSALASPTTPMGEMAASWMSTTTLACQSKHIIALSKGNKTLDTSSRRNAVTQKQNKGGNAYASGKALVALLEGGDEQRWPTAIAKELPDNDFSEIWVVCLQHYF